MSTFPHSLFFCGRCASFRTGSPLTPRAGEMAACAFAWSANPRHSAAVAMKLLLKIMTGSNKAACVDVKLRKEWIEEVLRKRGGNASRLRV